MAKVGNSRGAASDITKAESQASGGVYSGGRKAPGGMKDLAGCRAANMAHKASFRSGGQDARDTNGPKSPSALQLKTRRKGGGAANVKPSARG